MAAMTKAMCIVFITAVLVAAVATPVEAALSCDTVLQYLSPCYSYLTSLAPLPGGCCDGVKDLNAAANTTPFRQTACTCMKSFATTPGGVIVDRAKAEGLPGQCGVNIPYKISPSTDCSTVV